MGIRGRELQAGDEAMTDYNGPMTRVLVVERREQRGSQTGIQFRVRPNLRNGGCQSWYDSEWFEPAPPTEGQRDG